MKTVVLFIVFLGTLACISCESRTSQRTNDGVGIGYSIEMDQTVGGAQGGGLPVTMCQVATTFNGGAGVYTVTKIVGVTEEGPEGGMAGFTYVTLNLDKAWVSGTPADVVIRVSGGPIGHDKWAGGPFVIKKGEVAGFVLWAPRPENKDYYSVAPTALFQQKDGYYDSKGSFKNQYGELSLDEIGALIADDWGKDPAKCPKAPIAGGAPSQESIDQPPVEAGAD